MEQTKRQQKNSTVKPKRDISQQEISNISRSVSKEFPDDPALQEIHISRKILALKARKKNMKYLEYIKSLKSND